VSRRLPEPGKDGLVVRVTPPRPTWRRNESPRGYG
jgi:hypothetical protein